MTDFNEFVDLAQELITENGRSVTLVEHQDGNSDKPWDDSGNDTSVTVTGCFIPSSSSGFGYQMATDAELARVSQVLLLPGPNDYSNIRTIKDGGTEWNVEWVKLLQPADIIVLTAVGVKR